MRRFAHWFFLFLTTDAAFLFAAWLALKPGELRSAALFLGLFMFLALAAGIFAELRQRRKDETALLRFLEAPGERTEEGFLARFPDSEAARALCARFFAMQSQVNEKTVDLGEYRDYVEAWVHEVKTPLSLFTMVLDNHGDELPVDVGTRLQYVRYRINEDVERILYYARLQADHPDIRFSRFRLDLCVREALAEYRPFLEEKQISVEPDQERIEVDSDSRIVRFLLSQLLDNAVKYADGSVFVCPSATTATACRRRTGRFSSTRVLRAAVRTGRRRPGWGCTSSASTRRSCAWRYGSKSRSRMRADSGSRFCLPGKRKIKEAIVDRAFLSW